MFQVITRRSTRLGATLLLVGIAACNREDNIETAMALTSLKRVPGCEAPDLERPPPGTTGPDSYGCIGPGRLLTSILYTFPSAHAARSGLHDVEQTLLHYTSVGANIVFTTDSAEGDRLMRADLGLKTSRASAR